MMKTPTLYRFYGQDGQLLYIGRTIDPPARFRQHRSTQPFWPDVRAITLEHFADEAELDTAEPRAIREEQPMHNKAHNSGPREGHVVARLMVDAAASASCTALARGLAWYCDSCQNHGTSDCPEECAAMIAAHIAAKRVVGEFCGHESIWIADLAEHRRRVELDSLISLATGGGSA